MKSIIQQVLNKIWIWIWKFLWKNFPYRILNELKHIQNIQNLNYSDEYQKRVLICYRVHGFFSDITENTGRTLHFEIYGIVNVFVRLGFIVDIADCNETTILTTIDKKKYSVIFGFGEMFYQMANKQPYALSILYMTEAHPDFSLNEEKKRIDYYYLRHKKRIKICRSGLFYKHYHLKKTYSAVIVLGEISNFFNEYKLKYNIFPTGIINNDFVLNIEKHTYSRNQFLWFGSIGAVHKGLDLLVDIFSNRDDMILHICGLDKSEKKKLKIPKRNNIIEYDFVDTKSELFIKIVNLCSYIILPSCSEGFSTSITTGMLHGLIPIVPRHTGFDRLSDLAIFLNDFSVEYIETVLTELLNEPFINLKNLSYKVYKFAHQNFIQETFRKKFETIISDILNKTL